METRIESITAESLAAAKKILEEGGAVAFPTETVYGLGADARRDDAVRRIYEIKGRPSDNPLIVHIHEEYDLSLLVADDSSYAFKLREAFLPGPLTLVYKSKGKVSSVVSCGLDTLAVRVPSHPAAREFLRYVDMPVAAPSANISKHVSPVSAEHVFNDLNGRIPLILDGGDCSGGIESTVCDVTGEYPVVLREGLISREMIARVAGKCGLYVPQAGEKVRSPGMKYKHYAPTCDTYLFGAEDAAKARERFESFAAAGKRVVALCEHSVVGHFPDGYVLDLGASPEEMATNLYRRLREGEKLADIIIAVKPKEQDGIMAGVQNRLIKACGGELK